MLRFGFNFGVLAGGKPPLIQGDYIWYSLDDDDGFLSDNGIRKINDKGNTIMVGADGSKDGTMYSGRNIALTGDGLVQVPINATLGGELITDIVGIGGRIIKSEPIPNGLVVGYDGINDSSRIQMLITELPNNTCLYSFNANIISGTAIFTSYYDGSTQVPLPNGDHIVVNGLNTIELKASAYAGNSILVYFKATNSPCETEYTFNTAKEITDVQGSVTVFNATTKEFEQVGADGIGSKELVVNGDFSDVELPQWTWYNTQHEIINEQLKIISPNSSDGAFLETETISSKFYKINITCVESSSSAECRYYKNDVLGTKKFTSLESFSYYTTGRSTGQDFILRSSVGGDYGIWDNISIKEVLPLSTYYDLKDGTYGTIIKLHTAQFTQDDLDFFTEQPERVLQWCWGEIVIPSGLVKDIEDKVYWNTQDKYIEINDASELPYQGTATYNTRTNSGIQTIRCELDTDNVPTGVITNNQIRFRVQDDYVNTNVSVDGSQTDFSVMIAWVPVGTGKLQHIASSGGVDGTDNKFELRINDDDTVSAVLGKNVFDMTPMIDPNSEVHAMIAVYNQATGEIQGAVDGGTLASMGTITFDGQTDVVWFGTNKSLADSFDGYIGEGVLSAAMEGQATFDYFWDKVQLDYCDRNKPIGEYLSNHSFDCGTLGWGFDSAYPAIITDNGDGSLHLKTDSNFGSLVPSDQTFDAADWVIEVKFRNQIGNGKISFRRPNNVWVSTPTIGDGVHQSNPFSGAIKEIHVGADGDATYEADYEYISLRKRDSNIVTYLGDTVTKNGKVITHGTI